MPRAFAMKAVLCLALSGCAPTVLDKTPEAQPNETLKAESAPVAETKPPTGDGPERPRKLFGILRDRDTNHLGTAPDSTLISAASKRDEVGSNMDEPLSGAGAAPDGEVVVAGDVDTEQPPLRRPFLGFLRKRESDETEVGDESEVTVLAAAPAQDAVRPDPELSQPPSLQRGSGLFGGLRGSMPSNDAANGGVTGPVPPGEVIRVCEVRRRDMGKSVARSEGYRLIDTDPTSTEPRKQYITGFKDGCARQFTAALALFGSPQVHEATRYAPDNDTPYSDLDRAYERIKNRICGVRRGQFCTDNRAAKLARETVFVTVYPRFGGPGNWVEILIHKGQLIKYQIRSR